jgi:hypothetical protein
MKKIFTLLFASFIIGSGSLFAQSAIIFKPAAHAIVIKTNFHRYDDLYSFTRAEHAQRIQKINQEYNDALKDIVKMRFLSAAQKVQIIRTIELKRADQIKNVNARFNDSRNKYNDYYYDSNFRWRR